MASSLEMMDYMCFEFFPNICIYLLWGWIQRSKHTQF